MEFFEALATRRSIRKYQETPVEEAKLRAVLEAVRQSPTWANMQGPRVIVVRDAVAKQGISELSYLESFFAPKGYKSNPAKAALATAPVVLVLCADPAQSGSVRGQEYYLTDTGIAAQSLMLAARALGLGTARRPPTGSMPRVLPIGRTPTRAPADLAVWAVHCVWQVSTC